ncbi:unnamed protein product, partial [Hymenolepis diminuta]
MKKRIKLESSASTKQSADFSQKSIDKEDQTLLMKQLKNEIERKESQIRQLTEQVERNTA